MGQSNSRPYPSQVESEVQEYPHGVAAVTAAMFICIFVIYWARKEGDRLGKESEV